MRILAIAGLLLTFGCQDGSDSNMQKKAAMLEKINNISNHLNSLGFKIDNDKINIEIKNDKEMTEIFSNLNQQVQTAGLQNNTLGQGRLAFYDPNSQTIFIKDVDNDALTDGYLAHELMHAYQDQKWGFNNIWSAYFKNPTTQNYQITEILIEGHAELGKAAFEQKVASSAKEKEQLMERLKEEISDDCAICDKDDLLANMPYEVGIKFFGTLHEQGGWPLVEEIFVERPKATKEILHPEKLFREKNLQVKLPIWQNQKYKTKLLRQESMGEMYLWQHLMSYNMGRRKSLNMAKGLLGDIKQTYVGRDNSKISLWRLIFLSKEQAEEIFNHIKNKKYDEKIIQKDNTLDIITSNNIFLKKLAVDFLQANLSK